VAVGSSAAESGMGGRVERLVSVRKRHLSDGIPGHRRPAAKRDNPHTTPFAGVAIIGGEESDTAFAETLKDGLKQQKKIDMWGDRIYNWITILVRG
jgi:hypothetical protein